MSLLNQVLHDLDERASPTAPKPLRLAPEAPLAQSRHADDFAQPPSRDWVRILVWSGMAIVFGLALWSYLQPMSQGWRHAPVVVSQVVAIPALRSESTAPVLPTAREPALSDIVAAVTEPARQVEEPAVRGAEPKGDGVATGAMQESQPAAPHDKSASLSSDYLILRNTAPDHPQVSAAVREPRRDLPVSRAVVKSVAEQPGSQVERARTAIEHGDLAEAEVLLTRHLERSSGDIEARELLIGLMLRGERNAEALPQLAMALALSPQRWPLHLVKARLLLAEGQIDGARSSLQAIPAGVTQRASALQMLGALEQQAGRVPEAQAIYRELVALTPLSGAAWVGLAISLDSLGDEEAATAFGRALKIGGLPDPAAVYARNRLRELGAGDE